MKKFCLLLLVGAFITAAFGCAPQITVTVSPSAAAEETETASAETEKTAESPVMADEAFSDGKYDLADIMFECDEPMEYYQEDAWEEGYMLAVSHAIMLDVQQIKLDPNTDPIGDEEAMDELCEYAVESFLSASSKSVDIEGDPEIKATKVDGAAAYYTEFEAMSGDIPVKSGCTAFATKDYLYTVSVIVSSADHENIYPDLINSITIINHADYSAQPSQTDGAGSSEDAISAAEDYLDLTAFSRDELIEQLVYEGYSEDVASAAVDSLDVDWSEQAVKSAQEFLDSGGMSYDGLIDMLKYSGFSSADAKAAVDSLDADWREQAVIAAAGYIKYNEMYDEDELIDQLEFEGFSKSDAQYGARQALEDAGR